MNKTFTPKVCNLKSQIEHYKKYLTNILNAEMMLFTGEIGITSIVKLLTEQKKLATLATSGSLSSAARSMLDIEFNQIKEEIDRIAKNTNYMGQRLLDGSLYSPADLITKYEMNSFATQGQLEIKAPLKAGDSIQINDVNFIVKKSENLTGLPNEIAETNTTQDATTSLMNAINSTINTLNDKYTFEKQQLSGLKFIPKGSKITISSKSAGEDFNENGNRAITTGGHLVAGDNALLVNNHPAGNATIPLSLTGFAGTNGDLSAGRTTATGTVCDTILDSIDSIDTSGISNNPDFLGGLKGFKAFYNGHNGFADVILKVGDYKYIARNVPNAPNETTLVRFSSEQYGGGYFDITINPARISGESKVKNQVDADLFDLRLNEAFDGIVFLQNRDIKSYTAAGTIYPAHSITPCGNLAGSKMQLINHNFNNLEIEKIEVTPCKQNISSYKIEMKINGHTYKSGFDADGRPEKDIKCHIEPNASIALLHEYFPNSMLIYKNSLTPLNINGNDNALAVEAALIEALGVNNGGSSLTFKIGANEDDVIKVQIPPATLEALYKDSDGFTVDERYPRIDTQNNAFSASDILDQAINKATSTMIAIVSLNNRFINAGEIISQQIESLESALGYENIICAGNIEFA
jgi:flagellin-like hook-associated protein FlgL